MHIIRIWCQLVKKQRRRMHTYTIFLILIILTAKNINKYVFNSIIPQISENTKMLHIFETNRFSIYFCIYIFCCRNVHTYDKYFFSEIVQTYDKYFFLKFCILMTNIFDVCYLDCQKYRHRDFQLNRSTNAEKSHIMSYKQYIFSSLTNKHTPTFNIYIYIYIYI